MSRIHVNIGSNTGDRAALIERAVAALAVRLDPDGNAEIRLAPLIESEAWGFSSDNRFLNLGLMVDVPAIPIPRLYCSVCRRRNKRFPMHPTDMPTAVMPTERSTSIL